MTRITAYAFSFAGLEGGDIRLAEFAGKPILIVTPLAVSFQTRAEAHKFGIEADTSRDGKVTAGITITNYEQLHHFDPVDFGGLVCDESSAIKSFGGVRRAIVTDFMRKMRYRLLATATAGQPAIHPVAPTSKR